MPETSDLELLRDYDQQGSEGALAELVRRHVGLVNSTALRHVEIAAHAEEITQVVFVILARKAARLRPGTVLEGWLYEATRLAALAFLRAERRRHWREQQAIMQFTLQESTDQSAWTQLAPLLDEAMGHLGKKDREALILRYFKEKKLGEVAAALQVTEGAAQRRVHRAVEKLRRFFCKRGIVLPAAVLTAALSANSVAAAPAVLTQSVTALAVAKGGAAGRSTLTLIKGVLKLMAWAKAKTALVAAAIILLATGATTVALKEYQDHRTEAWEIPSPDNPPANFGFNFPNPPEVRIKPSIYPGFKLSSGPASALIPQPDGSFIKTNSNPWTAIGLGVTLADIVRTAYEADSVQTAFLTSLPSNKLYDYVSNLPERSGRPLQELLRKQFGLTGHWEILETNVLVLKDSNPDNPGLKPAESLMHSLDITNLGLYDRFTGCEREVAGRSVYIDQTIATLIQQLELEKYCDLPIIDETDLTNRFDFFFKHPAFWGASSAQAAYKDALATQLGLELAPARRQVKMLIVTKVP